jgi:Na+-translocating ferredoxin:NAD+ oxidoreductase RnfG subunit
MFQKITILLFILMMSLFAQDKVSIEEILKSNYDANISMKKKSLILTKTDVTTIQKNAKAKLGSKIVRYYTVKEGEIIKGHALLLQQRIRTKKAGILYMVDANNMMLGIEIVAFHEPSEYKPNDEWKKVFEGKTKEDELTAGKDIATISGATLSARAIADASRLALAIVEQKL